MSTQKLPPPKRLLIRPRTAIIVLLVVHFFGLIGLAYPGTRPWFEAATPLSLLLTCGLLLYFHTDWNTAFRAFVLIAWCTGYGIEVAGVHTQRIFGAYQYDTTLGLKVFDVPLLIGINWLILVYALGVIIHSLKLHWLLNSLLTAACMTLLDYFIEPVAIFHRYWHWESSSIPLQNYTSWFIVSFFLSCIFFILPFRKVNPLAGAVISIQLAFFVLLQIMHKI